MAVILWISVKFKCYVAPDSIQSDLFSWSTYGAETRRPTNVCGSEFEELTCLRYYCYTTTAVVVINSRYMKPSCLTLMFCGRRFAVGTTNTSMWQ